MNMFSFIKHLNIVVQYVTICYQSPLAFSVSAGLASGELLKLVAYYKGYQLHQ